MNRIQAMLEVGHFIREFRPALAALPRDAEGKPANIEIRKLLAVDPEMAIAMAALIATMYFSLEHEARCAAGNAFEGRG